jgi:hypothetical protein
MSSSFWIILYVHCVYLHYWGLTIKISQYTHLYAHNTRTFRWVFMRFCIGEFYSRVSILVNLHSDVTRIMCSTWTVTVTLFCWMWDDVVYQMTLVCSLPFSGKFSNCVGDTPTFWRWSMKHIHVIHSHQYIVCTHVWSLTCLIKQSLAHKHSAVQLKTGPNCIPYGQYTVML